MANRVVIKTFTDIEMATTEELQDDEGWQTTLEGVIEVSDGYHTMSELYEHRHRLFLALCKVYDNYITPLGCKVICWKSLKHSDGTSFDGWFIMGMIVEDVQSFDASAPKKPPYQITYHLPSKYWHLANVMERDKAPEWDGHTSNDVLERLLRL